jgi:hypothetical protein
MKPLRETLPQQGVIVDRAKPVALGMNSLVVEVYL